MRIYTVHERQGAPADGEGLVFVREGFSFPAFFFGLVWFVFHRLWLALVLYIALLMLLTGSGDLLGMSEAALALCALAIQFLLGCEAGDIRRWTLERRLYRRIGIAAGRTLDEAEHDFLRGWNGPAIPPVSSALPASSLTRPVLWPRQTQQEERQPLGLFPGAGG